ncbi:MAG: AAA family ATPase [Ornithinimicrobium sp.]|uniref:AAA family ATPase n=1 Tax=Ornithinimicrobium sp. TaxID=1977084 RepID=UPI0026E103C3|nr:AAA family ATPase [Ornithinimicrobium sp.]MDO5740443.1 AAA family ATPase [Ornithinimicrobium sp.]
MSRTTVAAVIEDLDLRSALQSVASEAVDVELVGVGANLAEISSVLEDPELDVVLVHTELRRSQFAAVISDLQRQRPFVGVLVIAPESDAGLLSSVMELGARGVLLQPLSLDEFQARVDAVGQWSRGLRQFSGGTSDERGQVIAVAGARGGAGVSTIATLLAHECSRAGTVCLVDADLRKGSIAYLTDVKPRRNLTDLATVASELTGRNVRDVAVDAEAGFAVISAPTDVEQADDVSATAMTQVLHQLRFQYDITIIDVGSTLESAQAVALEVADHVVLVVTPDVASVNSARQAMHSWERLSVRPSSAVTVVMNRTDRRREVQAALVERVLAHPLSVSLPDEFAQLEPGHNSGNITLVKGGSIRSGVLRLARELQLVAAPEASSRRSAGRRRERGQSAVETPMAVALFLLATVLGIQVLFAASCLVFTRHAATEGAREYAVSRSVSAGQASAEAALPGWAGANPSFSAGPGKVTVSTTIPMVLPVGGDFRMRISQSASYTAEPRP